MIVHHHASWIMIHHGSSCIMHDHSSPATKGSPFMAWGVVWEQGQKRNSHLALSLGQTLCLLVFVFVVNRCLCLTVFFCLPAVCVYGPLNAVLFNQASFPDPDGQFPDPMVYFQTKMVIFFKAASSQKRSRRNSGQNRPIERSTALTGTIFATVSVFMSRKRR